MVDACCHSVSFPTYPPGRASVLVVRLSSGPIPERANLGQDRFSGRQPTPAVADGCAKHEYCRTKTKTPIGMEKVQVQKKIRGCTATREEAG